MTISWLASTSVPCLQVDISSASSCPELALDFDRHRHLLPCLKFDNTCINNVLKIWLFFKSTTLSWHLFSFSSYSLLLSLASIVMGDKRGTISLSLIRMFLFLFPLSLLFLKPRSWMVPTMPCGRLPWKRIPLFSMVEDLVVPTQKQLVPLQFRFGTRRMHGSVCLSSSIICHMCSISSNR